MEKARRRRFAPPKAAPPETMTRAAGLTLPGVIKRLLGLYGRQSPPGATDPFELIVLENVAYLAPPERRKEAFEELRRTVGLSPRDILQAKARSLQRVTSRGILKSTFAGKLRECARIVVEEFGGDLRPHLRGPIASAKAALRRFPGIGEPGAEKILLLSGRHSFLAPDSNALRVLVRLGLVRQGATYAKTYAAARQAATSHAGASKAMVQAHLLLQRHGRSLCKRRAPACDDCPLEPECAHAWNERRRSGARVPRRKES